MSEYVSKDIVVKNVLDQMLHSKSLIAMHERLMNLEAADVAEVVRCKNCENADSNGMGCCYVWCNEMQQAVSEDGWCYRGADMRGKDDV